MRESRAIAERLPRALLPRDSEVVDAFAIADVLIEVDGRVIRLGDYWNVIHFEAEASRHG